MQRRIRVFGKVIVPVLLGVGLGWAGDGTEEWVRSADGLVSTRFEVEVASVTVSTTSGRSDSFGNVRRSRGDARRE